MAPLPEEVNGHFGANLVRYLLSQHYQCRVTMPLLSVRPESSCGKRGGYERPLVTFSSRVQLDGLPLSWSAVWRVVVHR